VADSHFVIRTLVAAAAFLLSAAILAVGAAPTSATVSCNRFAATSGSDSATGTSASPFRTAQKLMDSLAAGETGCLAPGTYNESLRVNHGGQPGAPIQLTSAPGGKATLAGRLYVPQSSNDVIFADLALDGRNASDLPSPTVDADSVTFAHDDVTDGHTGICFSIGSLGWGTAHDVVLDGNRIHDCGRLPYGSTNHDHGIYVESARGTVITNNYIFDNADRGIQLYPDAQGSTIANNVIDGNGEGIIFSGDSGLASSNNVARRNVISNSRVRYNLESWWPNGNPVGTGNLASDNCLWNGTQGNVADQVGFTASNNVVANPGYADRTGGNFALSSSSACAGFGPSGNTTSSAPPPPPPPPAAAAPASTAPPKVSGTTRVGSRLSASAGSWSGTGLTFSYAWQRCDAAGVNCATTNVTGSAYSLTNADVGATLRVVVKAQNAAGTATARSAPTAIVPAKKGGKTVRAQSLPARPQKLPVLLRMSYRLGRR
jgi:parallel beta-helix repeat protein